MKVFSLNKRNDLIECLNMLKESVVEAQQDRANF